MTKPCKVIPPTPPDLRKKWNAALRRNYPTIRSYAETLIQLVRYRDEDGRDIGVDYGYIREAVLRKFPRVTRDGPHKGCATKMPFKELQEFACELNLRGIRLPFRPRRRINKESKLTETALTAKQKHERSPKGQAMYRRYNESPKGRERHFQYDKSPKGHEKNRRYAESPKGRETRWRLKNEQQPNQVSSRTSRGRRGNHSPKESQTDTYRARATPTKQRKPHSRTSEKRNHRHK